MDLLVCEASGNYLWHLGDKVGSGATSDVYKAYNIATGQIVAAKVSKIRSPPRPIRPTNTNAGDRNYDSQSVFDREINFLKNISHDNIVRFIDTEIVTTSNDSGAPPNREVLFLEFCNGGSVGDMLRLPANRYGFSEDVVMQIMKDVTGALKYLHQKKIIHRDIKPDNIMQSIDINGKTTYKLTDLGVARQINPDENTSYSIRGTEEYVHPAVYVNVFPEIKVNVNGKSTVTRVLYPFEVEMWSFGVTIYQCSTGRIPFLPFEGTRHDRNTMREILTSIPPGSISGVQSTYNGGIEYSEHLPDWCRLSLNLKDMLEKLLARLFEINHDRLMKHEEFFIEIDKILSLVPVYYLNLKRLTLTCTYFQANEPINKLFEEIQGENEDDTKVDYYCLFQNVHYPISKSDRISIKTFHEQFHTHPSREKPLVIYTFSSSKFDQKLIPKVNIPEIQPMKNVQDRFFSVHDWSKNIIGLFFYLKNQLVEYEYIMKTTQSSITTIHRFLKSKLFKLLCSIRNELVDCQAIYELESVATVIESTVASKQPSMEAVCLSRKSIVQNAPMNETSAQLTISPEQQSLSAIRPSLRSSMDLYRTLTEYDKELTVILEQNFNDQLKVTADRQPVFNTADLSKQINKYSLYIRQIDKYTTDALDLGEKFRRDTLISRSTSLQMTSNILRQKLLQEIHDQFIRLINEGCYPLILEIFSEYRKWTKLQADINLDLQRIRLAYEEQRKSSISTDQLRQIIVNELRTLGASERSSSVSDQSTLSHPDDYEETPRNEQPTNVHVQDSFSYLSSNTILNDVSITMQDTTKQVKDNTSMLDDIIKNLYQQFGRITIN